MPSGQPLLHSELTETIIGSCFAVHNELGSGFLEGVYANALTILLRGSGLKVEREVSFTVMFRGHPVGRYRADLIVESKVIVEIKTAKCLDQWTPPNSSTT